MTKIINNRGEPVAADDPDRQIWYGVHCGFWTDDWSLLKKVGSGIPSCPTCGNVGCQTSAEDWDNGVLGFDKENPGYAAFLNANKSTCLRSRGGLVKAWKDSKK